MAWLKSNWPSEDFQLIDCREQHEWNAGHIEGALFIPLSQWDLHVHKIDPNKPAVVYCRSGMRSIRATNYLLQQGKQAASLIGGYMAYQG
jgi:rhodanese-related sulfurtransferase